MEIAKKLRNSLEDIDGFISIERFQSLNNEGKLLSLSFWRDEASIETWRSHMEHRIGQKKGRDSLFSSYKIHVARVVRDYTDLNRGQAPDGL